MDEGFSYTAKALFLGIGAAVLLWFSVPGGLTGVVNPLLSLFALERSQTILNTSFGVYLMSVVFCIAAIGVLYLSENIESVFDRNEDERKNSISAILLYGIVSLFAIIVLKKGITTIFDDNFGNFVGAIFGLFSLLILIPALIADYALMFLMVCLIVSSIFCLPRVILYYGTGHPLRSVADKSERDGRVPAEDMPAALSTPGKSKIEEKAMLHELQRVAAELEEKKRHLKEEYNSQKMHIQETTERKKAEQRVSTLLAEIDSMRAEMEIYAKSVKEMKTHE